MDSLPQAPADLAKDEFLALVQRIAAFQNYGSLTPLFDSAAGL